jgi:hypothetical protein
MTEAEWLAACDPYRMASVLQDYRPLYKFRQLACACLQTIAGELRAAQLTQQLEFVEWLAEERDLPGRLEKLQTILVSDESGPNLNARDLIPAIQAARYRESEPDPHPFAGLSGTAYRVAVAIDEVMGVNLNRYGTANEALYGSLVRCIFGNPFRPVTFNPAWRTDTAVIRARQMYDSRDFGAMPILADALQDAGCEDEQVLSHCRDAGPHARGCWVVDGVLGLA